MHGGYDRLSSTGNVQSATITLASLANSPTAGRQSTVVTVTDDNNEDRVPYALDVELTAKIAAGAPANDKAVYLFVARSLDGTNFEVGPPALGASDAAFSFTTSPVGAGAVPTGLTLVGALSFNAAGEQVRKQFQIIGPSRKLVFVVLNYSGQALTATAGDHSLKIGRRYREF